MINLIRNVVTWFQSLGSPAPIDVFEIDSLTSLFNWISSLTPSQFVVLLGIGICLGTFFYSTIILIEILHKRVANWRRRSRAIKTSSSHGSASADGAKFGSTSRKAQAYLAIFLLFALVLTSGFYRWIPIPWVKAITHSKYTCHPFYSGCLNIFAIDYDCEGGIGDGPQFTGRVRVKGYDIFRLDRDRDGWGCD